MLKAQRNRLAEESCRKPVNFDEFEHTTDSWTSTYKARQRAKVTVKVRSEFRWDSGCREVGRGNSR